MLVTAADPDPASCELDPEEVAALLNAPLEQTQSLTIKTFDEFGNCNGDQYCLLLGCVEAGFTECGGADVRVSHTTDVIASIEVQDCEDGTYLVLDSLSVCTASPHILITRWSTPHRQQATAHYLSVSTGNWYHSPPFQGLNHNQCSTGRWQTIRLQIRGPRSRGNLCTSKDLIPHRYDLPYNNH